MLRSQLLNDSDPPPLRAAVSLLLSHRDGEWLKHYGVVVVDEDVPHIDWARLARAAEHPLESPDGGALALVAATLAGHPHSVPLGHLLDGLDAEHSALVATAFQIATGQVPTLAPVLQLHQSPERYYRYDDHQDDDDF